MESPVDVKIRRALNFLFGCLDEDLRSGQPSREPSFLNAVLNGLYQVEFVGNAHNQVNALLKKFDQAYPTAGVVVKPELVMQEILDASQAEMVSESEFLDLAHNLNIPPLAPTINFLTQLLEIIRLIPMKVYPSEDHRRRVLDALQEAIDAVIAVEGGHQ